MNTVTQALYHFSPQAGVFLKNLKLQDKNDNVLYIFVVAIGIGFSVLKVDNLCGKFSRRIDGKRNFDLD